MVGVCQGNGGRVAPNPCFSGPLAKDPPVTRHLFPWGGSRRTVSLNHEACSWSQCVALGGDSSASTATDPRDNTFRQSSASRWAVADDLQKPWLAGCLALGVHLGPEYRRGTRHWESGVVSVGLQCSSIRILKVSCNIMTSRVGRSEGRTHVSCCWFSAGDGTDGSRQVHRRAWESQNGDPAPLCL
jgi:hypothetical protein